MPVSFTPYNLFVIYVDRYFITFLYIAVIARRRVSCLAATRLPSLSVLIRKRRIYYVAAGLLARSLVLTVHIFIH
jgi:hypothetical protein